MTLLVSPARIEFQENCKQITGNMFGEHTYRRYLQGSTQKLEPIKIAPTSMVPIASTQLNTTALIGWTCLGVGLISFTVLGALSLFHLAERKRYQNGAILIGVTDCLSD